MTLDPAGAWQAVLGSPLLGLALTLAAYELGRALSRRTGGHPLATPVLVAVVVTVATLLLLDVPYADYLEGAQVVSLLLGPATVALAVPLHRELPRVRAAALPLLAGLVAGSLAAATTGIVLTRVLGGSEELVRSMAPKAATTPVAIALAETVGGVPALAAVLAILTGIVGAMAGPSLLTLLRVHDERVRGFAIGVASHGIGTARALQESATVGAFSGLGMALNALTTALALPLLALTPLLG